MTGEQKTLKKYMTSMSCNWARDTVMWHWSADTHFLQLSITNNKDD